MLSSLTLLEILSFLLAVFAVFVIDSFLLLDPFKIFSFSLSFFSLVDLLMDFLVISLLLFFFLVVSECRFVLEVVILLFKSSFSVFFLADVVGIFPIKLFK